MQKYLSIWLIVVVILVIVLAGCSQNTESQGNSNVEGENSNQQTADSSNKQTDGNSKEQTAEGSNEPTVVPAFIDAWPRISSYDDNLLTQKMEKKLNIDIQLQTSPRSGVQEKQNILLSSGEYPPVFVGGQFSKVDQLKYGGLGVFLPLNDLIGEHAPNIQKAFDEKPWLKEGLTTPDGNIYGLPGLLGCYHCTYPMKMWINEEWLETLNLEMPTTTEEFEEVLLAFKNGDPNGNGEADEIPLSGRINSIHSNPIHFLMNAFVYTNPGNYLQVADNQVDLVADNPEWKQGLTYIHNLYSQGLIDQQAFTQNNDALRQLANHPDEAVLGASGAFWSGAILTIGPANDNRWNKYPAVPPLIGPDGVQTAFYTGDQVNDVKFVITDKASEAQQIAAIKIANYLYSKEGALDMMFGVKGKGWQPAKKGELGIEGEPAFFNGTDPLSWDEPKNWTWSNDFMLMSQELYNSQAVSQDPNAVDGYEVFLLNQTKKYDGHEPEESLANLYVDPSKVQTVAEMGTVINNYIKQNAVQFVIGDKDLSSDWVAYVQGLKDLGLDEYLQIYQTAYGANK